MAFTEEQLLAINKRNSNILVSAGAGSGKTAVLTERIVSLIKEGVDLNKLLVLTFTNAAALEMKERVRQKLKDLSSDSRCKNALKFIDSAKITTFDGYALFLVKKYFYVLNISKDIKIANHYFLEIKALEILDEILDTLYKDSVALDKYFTEFKAKNDDTFKYNILSIYNSLQLNIHLDDYLNNYNKIYNDINVNSLIDRYVSLIKECMEYLNLALIKFEESLSNDNSKLIDEIELKLEQIYNLKTYDDIYYFINNFKLSSVKKSTDETKEKRKAVKDNIDYIKSLLSFNNIDEMKVNILNNKIYSDLFIDIIKKLDLRLNKFKKDNNYYDFIDIQKLAIKLLDSNQDILNEIKNNLYEILIDEYQDTSDIQEEFISRIENNNLYMVGDMKQSIYRFRNANPYIFKDKYDKYSHNQGGIKIDLNKNFRSRSEVLNNINTIFNKAMTNRLGDSDYLNSHQMNYGFDTYDSHIDNIEYNMDIFVYDKEDYNNDNDSYSNSEIEASFVSKKIKELIDSKIKIYDKSIKTFREIKYKDICIITDRNTKFSLYKKILEYNGIPVAINADSELKDSKIVPIIYNLINLVISEALNKYDEDYFHSYYSIARSYLYQMDDDIIFENVFKAKNNKERINDIISNKALNISKNIYNYSAKEIYLNILNEFDVESKLYLIGNVYESLVVLEYIMDFISNINDIGVTIFDINKYILDILNEKSDIKYSISVENSPGVKLMNIHKSKGLEFPICFFVGLSTKFNHSDYYNKIGYLAESGFYFENDNSISIIKAVGIRDLMVKDISEKIRLLYVMLTRTREKMIIVEENKTNIPTNYREIDSLSDILGMAFDDIKDYSKLITDLVLNKNYKLKINKRNIKYNKKKEYLLNDYYGNILEKNRISKEVIEVLSDIEIENLDFGNRLHEILESIDFNNPNLSNLNNEEYNIISNVLKNDLFKNIKNAKTYHEHEFYFNSDLKMYHGIIDLLAIYDDHIDIIDYKLKNIDSESYNRQLSIYRKYIESISNLKVNCYLLSLMDNIYKEVK